MIALDMKSCTSLSDSEKEALRSAINEKYNITTVIKTKEELINESLIEKDDTFGTVFTKGTLITIEEKDDGNDTFNYNISIYKTGLSMKRYRECVPKKHPGLLTGRNIPDFLTKHSDFFAFLRTDESVYTATLLCMTVCSLII